MATKTTVVVPVRIDSKVVARLKSRAQQEYRTVASLIRMAIGKYLEKEK